MQAVASSFATHLSPPSHQLDDEGVDKHVSSTDTTTTTATTPVTTINITTNNQHLSGYTFPAPSLARTHSTSSAAESERDQLRSPSPLLGHHTLSDERLASHSEHLDDERREDLDLDLDDTSLPRFPSYDLSSAPHSLRDIPEGLQQPRSMSFSMSAPNRDVSFASNREERPDHGHDNAHEMGASHPSSRPSSRIEAERQQDKPEGDIHYSSLGREILSGGGQVPRVLNSLGLGDYGMDHQQGPESGQFRHSLHGSHSHGHQQQQPHVIYGSSMSHHPYQHQPALYSGSSHPYAYGAGSAPSHSPPPGALQHERSPDDRPGVLPRLPAPTRQTNSQGFYLPDPGSHPGLAPRTQSCHGAIGGSGTHYGEAENPFPSPSYPSRPATADSVGDGMDPSLMHYGGHYYSHAHPYQDYGFDHHRPGSSGPAYYGDPSHHHHQQQQQHELRYLGPREDLDHPGDDQSMEHQQHQLHQQHQQSTREKKTATRRTSARRAGATRGTGSNIYHPTPQSMLAPNAPSLPWSGIAGVPSNAPPGRLAGIPTDDEFMSLPTKRSRGRRPPSSPELLFPSNPNIDPNEALIAYSGVTKTGKPRKIFLCKVPDCNKIFKRSEHLKRHVRSIHTEIKPFQCQWPNCGKLFSRHDNLNQHLRVHRSPGQSDASFSAQLEQFFAHRERADRSSSPPRMPVASTSDVVAGPSVLTLPPLQNTGAGFRHHHHHLALPPHSSYPLVQHHDDDLDLDENGAPIPRGARESTAGTIETEEGSLYAPSR